jgi:thiamine-phosphate pyrophosphorylase
MHTRLYLITPPKFELESFAKALDAALDAGDVACLQLRLKDVDDDTIRRATERLMPIAHGHGVTFILNDRPDLAAELGVDGVHIGQEDMKYAEARARMGMKHIVGVTCHASRHLAIEAAEAGADYVAFGAFYPTGTKADTVLAEAELLQVWQAAMVIPCVAIGGITVGNAAPLVTAGADFLAVSAGVWNHAEGPAEAVRAFNALFDALEEKA